MHLTFPLPETDYLPGNISKSTKMNSDMYMTDLLTKKARESTRI